jgi:membrane protein DedA with SNARE-associated domain
LESFLQTYGYLALFIGTFLEGETILALAGLAAHEGLMSFSLVVVIAALGGFVGDQFFFFLGRHYGNRLLNRHPRIAAKAPRVKQLLCRWDAPLVIMIRFMYGLRIAGPIIIGAAGISPWRLAFFNLIGSAIWAPVVAAVGYLAGHAVQQLMQDLELAKIVLLIVMVCGGLLGLLICHRR